MNNKAMTIIAAAAVVIAAFAGLSAVQGVDADSEAISSLQLGTSDVTIVPGGDSASILLKVSEAEYVPLGYKLTWYVASATQSGGSYSAEFNTDQSLGSRDVIGSIDISQVDGFQPKTDGVTISNTTFTMAETDGLGNYILDVKCSDRDQSGIYASGNYAIKCVVEVDVNTGNEQGMSVPPVYGIVTTKIGSESAPTELDTMEFVIGVPSMEEVSVSNEGIRADDKTWYATGLPPGLSMSPIGIVSGMPTGKDSSGKDLTFIEGSASVEVSVYSSEMDNGAVKITEYTLTVSISDRDPAMTLTLSSEASSGFIQRDLIYSAVQGTMVNLNVSVDVGRTLDVIAVTVIGDDGTSRITYSDGVAVPTTGVGEYYIVVNAVVDGTPITGYVILNVVSALDSLENSIVINGA